MTVSELITALQQQDPNAQVWIEGEWDNPVTSMRTRDFVQGLVGSEEGNFLLLSDSD